MFHILVVSSIIIMKIEVLFDWMWCFDTLSDTVLSVCGMCGLVCDPVCWLQARCTIWTCTPRTASGRCRQSRRAAAATDRPRCRPPTCWWSTATPGGQPRGARIPSRAPRRRRCRSCRVRTLPRRPKSGYSGATQAGLGIERREWQQSDFFTRSEEAKIYSDWARCPEVYPRPPIMLSAIYTVYVH